VVGTGVINTELGQLLVKCADLYPDFWELSNSEQRKIVAEFKGWTEEEVKEHYGPIFILSYFG